jgi:hypothetical protein
MLCVPLTVLLLLLLLHQVPETVDGWKVVKLPLRRHGRHLDHTVMLDFYTKLDAFLQGRRCELDY